MEKCIIPFLDLLLNTFPMARGMEMMGTGASGNTGRIRERLRPTLLSCLICSFSDSTSFISLTNCLHDST